MKESRSNGGDAERNDLDRRILDELRGGARTRKELVDELDEADHRIDARLRLLTAAGYVETGHGNAMRYGLREDPDPPPEDADSRPFDDSHFLVRLAASGAVTVLSGILYYGVLGLVIPTVWAGTAAIPLALLTGWLAIPPRRQRQDPSDDPRDSPPYPPI